MKKGEAKKKADQIEPYKTRILLAASLLLPYPDQEVGLFAEGLSVKPTKKLD
jgi:hypothetical protein